MGQMDGTPGLKVQLLLARSKARVQQLGGGEGGYVLAGGRLELMRWQCRGSMRHWGAPGEKLTWPF